MDNIRPTEQDNQDRTKSIMLIEDNEIEKTFFLTALGKIPGTSLYASVTDGAAAIKLLEAAETLPDMIFLDAHMPGMDGLECLSELLNHKRLRTIPVVMLSHATDTVDVTKYLGAKAFLKKPHDHRVLKERLQAIIDMDFSSHNYGADLTFQRANTDY